MPAAAPVPRGPSVLALGSAAGLLARPGCPVCRHAAEAGDRYLAWFAAEAHADPVTITRLCGSLGMCARHTRSLMRQPGAAARLTAVNRYVLEAAQDKLAGRGTRLAPCPACEHDQAAAGRALDTLLDGLADATIRERYRAAGGLCVPHLRAAARVRGYRHAVAWAAESLIARLRHGPPDLDLLAGGPDHDADGRAALRAALSPDGAVPPGACPVCCAAARSERDALLRGASEPYDRADAGDNGCLCAAHLRNAALTDRPRAQDLLAGQARSQAATLGRPYTPRRGRPARWLPGGRAPARDADCCPACRAGASAARQELDRCAALLAGPLPAGEGQPVPCVRHVLALRAAHPGAAQAAAELAAPQAGALVCELAEAFRKSTWTYRHESMGPEATAWRRAAGFLDGPVFGGCPPR